MSNTPGIRVIEQIEAVSPAVGLPGSIAGIVSPASWGPLNTPARITSWPDFQRKRGGVVSGIQASYDLYEGYRQGLQDIYHVRVGDGTEALATVTLKDRATTPGDTLQIDAKHEGTLGNRLSVQILAATLDPENKFRLRILLDGVPVAGEDYNELTVGAGGNVEEATSDSRYIAITDLLSTSTAPENLPALGTFDLTGGADGASALTDDHYIGATDASGNRTGLQALIPYTDELGLALIPGVTTQTVQAGLLSFAETYYFPLALLDSQGTGDDTVKTHRNALGQSSFGAYYYPRPFIADPLTGRDKYVSMSAVMAGYIARSDAMNRGPAGNPRVHKAPANNPAFYGTLLGLEANLDEDQIGPLNDLGINCARAFRGRGIRMWGARTLSSDLNWRYVPIRRTFQFAARSLKQAFLDAPFEPNYTGLWDQVKRSARGFLDTMVRDGMLEGAEGQGYAVVCDETNNPPESREAGNLFIDVGLAVVRPAEFVWLRFSRHEGTAVVTETPEQPA